MMIVFRECTMTPKEFVGFIDDYDRNIVPMLGPTALAARVLLVTSFANKLGEEKMFELIRLHFKTRPILDMCKWVSSPSRDFLLDLVSLGTREIINYVTEQALYPEVARFIKLFNNSHDGDTLLRMMPFTEQEVIALYNWDVDGVHRIVNASPQEHKLALAKLNPSDGLAFDVGFVVKHRHSITAEVLDSLDKRLSAFLMLLDEEVITDFQLLTKLSDLLTNEVKQRSEAVIDFDLNNQ